MSLSVEQQLALFKSLLSESCYDLTDAQGDIDKAFLKAISQGQTSAKVVINEKKTKKKSGYTLFLSENMGKEKMSMGEAVGTWKGLPQVEKDVWNAKAKIVISGEAPAPAPVKKTHKKSGYTLFLSEKMGGEKMKMGEAVGSWKVLPQEKKDEYNIKAKSF